MSHILYVQLPNSESKWTFTLQIATRIWPRRKASRCSASQKMLKALVALDNWHIGSVYTLQKTNLLSELRPCPWADLYYLSDLGPSAPSLLVYIGPATLREGFPEKKNKHIFMVFYHTKCKTCFGGPRMILHALWKKYFFFFKKAVCFFHYPRWPPPGLAKDHKKYSFFSAPFPNIQADKFPFIGKYISIYE